MPLDIVTVMDPIGSIKIGKDSTFAMLLEAQRRGHRLFYVLPSGLSVVDGVAQPRWLSVTIPLAGMNWAVNHPLRWATGTSC